MRRLVLLFIGFLGLVAKPFRKPAHLRLADELQRLDGLVSQRDSWLNEKREQVRVREESARKLKKELAATSGSKDIIILQLNQIHADVQRTNREAGVVDSRLSQLKSYRSAFEIKRLSQSGIDSDQMEVMIDEVDEIVSELEEMGKLTAELDSLQRKDEATKWRAPVERRTEVEPELGKATERWLAELE